MVTSRTHNPLMAARVHAVLPGGAAAVTSRTSGIRRSGAGCQVTGWTRAITRAGGRPSRGDIVPAVRSCHRIHLSRQG